MKKLLIICILFCSCNYVIFDNQDAEIEVGKEYLYSYDWDNENPFSYKEIDTVKVLDIKGIYVQWQYKDGYKASGKLHFFKHNQRPYEKHK